MIDLLLVVFVVVLLGYLAWRAGRLFSSSAPDSAQRPDALPAVLTLVGVSPANRPADQPQAFCAVSGVLTAPEISPTEVYQRWAVPADQPWPQTGQELDALYSPGKAATHWWLRAL